MYDALFKKFLRKWYKVSNFDDPSELETISTGVLTSLRSKQVSSKRELSASPRVKEVSESQVSETLRHARKVIEKSKAQDPLESISNDSELPVARGDVGTKRAVNTSLAMITKGNASSSSR